MRAVILAGGLGTRVRPYTFTVPKPLLPLGDRALLDHLIAQLVRNDIRDLTISVGYQAQLVRAYYGDGQAHGVRIDYIEESRPLGTAGCLALLRDRLVAAGEPFMLMNGDLFTRMDFRRMRAFHEERDAALTIGFVDHRWQSPFGVLQFEGDHVVGVVEKPAYVNPVSAGIYCIAPSAVELVPDDFFTMPDLALALRAAGRNVLGYRITEFWRALESRDHFEELLREAESDAGLQAAITGDAAAPPPAR